MSQDLNRRGRLSLFACLLKWTLDAGEKLSERDPENAMANRYLRELRSRADEREYNDRLWAREKSVKAEKRDRNAEREKVSFSLSLSLHFYLSSPPLHFFLALTIGHYILFENACELQRVVFHLEAELMEWTSVCGLPFSVRGNTDKPQLSTFCLISFQHVHSVLPESVKAYSFNLNDSSFVGQFLSSFFAFFITPSLRPFSLFSLQVLLESVMRTMMLNLSLFSPF